MIRDPGGTSPNENQDSPPSPKYDRILGRPPPPDDMEIPLDMTVRRKDSSDGQGSPTGADQSRDEPINLNVRPSVITKAPPPPIKKRISHMHTNGEIVLKSSVRTTTATTVESAPIVNVSSTYCDVSIEEHFRRSLGPTYSSIYGDKHQQQQQQQSSLNVLNNNISTGGTGPPSFVPDSPVHHVPPQKVHPLPLPLLLQKHSMDTGDSLPLTVTGPPGGGGGMRNHSSSSISSSSSVSSNSSISSSLSNTSGISSGGSSSNNNNNNNNNNNANHISIRPPLGAGIRVVAPETIELKLSSDPAPPVPLVPATVMPPSPGAPSSAASVAAISLTSPKHLHQQQPPPAISPASLTTTMSLSSSSPASSLASSPAPFHATLQQQQQQHQQKRPDSGEEVDDHFAKALGETWKKIQESNMNL
ncbi:dual specificity protein kinase splA [Anopheles arabiensis]|uniref:dual specificity protein kinase splA n=1 Tax=Anopheles arabiensis TaxID=7173 RepID=UPI001AAD4DB4|nr:dual specificity protein kinase splA [Anopheles arabiensis]